MSEATLESLQKVARPVSRETFERLLAFEGIFRKWASSINLVAPSTLPDLWTRHILDSAQLLPLLKVPAVLVDLGSGGGFPGAIMAILLSETPGSEVHLVESNRKKAAFLSSSLGSLGVRAKVHAERIEAVYPRIPKADVVTARALASLRQLLTWSAPWVAHGARGLFHKGRDFAAEIEESVQHWSFDLVEHPSVIEPGSVVLDVTNLKPHAGSSG